MRPEGEAPRLPTEQHLNDGTTSGRLQAFKCNGMVSSIAKPAPRLGTHDMGDECFAIGMFAVARSNDRFGMANAAASLPCVPGMADLMRSGTFLIGADLLPAKHRGGRDSMHAEVAKGTLHSWYRRSRTTYQHRKLPACADGCTPGGPQTRGAASHQNVQFAMPKFVDAFCASGLRWILTS
jgi:hypothetical protein